MSAVNESITFKPPRRMGVVTHSIIVILLIELGLWGMWQAANADIGPVFLLYLLPSLLAMVMVPILAYRAYALYGAFYVLEREGIRLRWGLRIEEIPMDVVEWVHPADDLEPAVPLPFFRLPGSVLGVRKLPGEGEVEFMASTSRELLIIATPGRAYAVSPGDRASFLEVYQQLAELGSITPLPARSIHPTFLINRVWSTPAARALILTGFLLGVILLALVLFSIPSRAQFHLGFLPSGEPGDLVPAVRLMLLPVLSWFFYLIDFFLGLFFFRDEKSHHLAYLVWFTGALTPLLFLVGLYFILRSG